MNREEQVKLLLIEDNSGDAILLSEIITGNVSREVNIAKCSRLAEAIEILSKEKFDLIVSDLCLPDSIGLSTLKKLLKSADDIPVIVLTGMVDKEYGREIVALGAKEYCIKDGIFSFGESYLQPIIDAIDNLKEA